MKTDVLVVGGGASGTAAGIQASRLGVKAVIAEETPWLGGMLTAAGVSAIDGNYRLPAGIYGEFRDSLINRYGGLDQLKTGWVSNVMFEPKVGNEIFQHMVSKEKLLEVLQNTRFISAKHSASDGWTVKFAKENKTRTIKAKILIDATELGDVAASCGVKYDVGMEARSVSHEDIAPLEANNVIQDLTYVMILRDYGRDVTIPKPDGYNPALFYCTAANDDCLDSKSGQKVWTPKQMITYGQLPNGKYMINWPIEGNDYYVNMIEMTPKERDVAVQEAKNFSLCYLYYMQTRLGFSHFGIDSAEFPTPDRLPFIPYHRESRRIDGLVRFNVNDIAKPFSQSLPLYRTGIAVGDYPVDHHHKRYPYNEQLPELHFYPIPSYTLPLGTLLPRQIKGLVVAEKSISVSNLVNGTTRLQPVVMQVGQVAGIVSALAIKKGVLPDEIAVRDVQSSVLNNGGYIMPYLDLEKSDNHFKSVQRIGATGILKGKGMNTGWKNETWFMTDSLVSTSELLTGLKDFDTHINYNFNNQNLSVDDMFGLLSYLADLYGKSLDRSQVVKLFGNEFDFSDNQRYVTRKELAVLLDYYIDPFDLKQVDFTGKYN